VAIAVALAGLMAGLPNVAAAEGAVDSAQLQLLLRSDRHSDPLALSLYGREAAWADLQPRRGRNLAYVDDEVRVQGQSGAWQVSLLARVLASVVSDQQSLELARDLETGERPVDDAHWRASLQFRALSGRGVALGRQWQPASGWKLQTEAQWLQLQRWRERALTGDIAFTAADRSYHFAALSTQRNDGLRFPFQSPFAAYGQAVLLSAQVQWQGSSSWAQAGLRDGGRLRWQGLPRQALRLTSDTREVDADGFVIYKPLAEGQYTQQRESAQWPWRATLAGGWADPSGQRVGLQLDHLPGYGWLPALQWSQAPHPVGPVFNALWRLHERRLELGAKWRGWQIQAGADRLGSSARSRTLALSWQAAWPH
jgi:hypothetical protein